jgi:hypothetical protein
MEARKRRDISQLIEIDDADRGTARHSGTREAGLRNEITVRN